MRKLFILAVALFMAASLSGTAHADHHVRMITVRAKVATWQKRVVVTEPSPIPDQPTFFNLIAVEDVEYYVWPDVSHGTKISPWGVDICYSWPHGGDTVFFQGIKAGPHFFDDKLHYNLPIVYTNRDGIQNCTHYRIPINKRHWLNKRRSPAMSATGWVRWKFFPDQEFRWKWGGSHVRYFQTQHDMNLSGWLRIGKRW